MARQDKLRSPATSRSRPTTSARRAAKGSPPTQSLMKHKVCGQPLTGIQRLRFVEFCVECHAEVEPEEIVRCGE